MYTTSMREHAGQESSLGEVERGEQQPGRSIGRRQFVREAIVGGAGLAALSREAAAAPLRERPEQEHAHLQTIQTGPFAGLRTRRSMLEHYFGAYDRLPPEVRVDFNERLQEMWSIKLRRHGKREPGVVAIAQTLCKEYAASEPRQISVDQYADEIQGIVEQIFIAFDWQLLAKEKHLDPVTLELVRDIATRISYKELFALCMTELLPMATGEQNKTLLDMILRTAGVQFLESIPALFDAYLSFGPYQFTRFAMQETERGSIGASQINPILPEGLHLPRRVEELRSIHHHIAAVAYMVENLCLAITLLQKQEDAAELLKRFSLAVERTPAQALTFVGAAHHAPQAACTALVQWLRRPHGEAAYSAHLRAEPQRYAQRYARNLNALYGEPMPKAEVAENLV